MANPLFGLLNKNPMNLMQMLSALKNNPMEVLQKAGLNIPNNINNPNAIVQHLISSGQLSQSQLNYAQQLAQFIGKR